MSIVKKRWDRFTMVPVSLLEDTGLSCQARFLFCYLSSKPDDWEFRTAQLAKAAGLSRDTFRKYINELISRGWVIRSQAVVKGRFAGNQYELIDRTLENRELNFRARNIPTLTNMESTNTESNKKDTNKIPSLHEATVQLYFDWYESLNAVKPKFTARDGKAAKTLIAYFKGLYDPDRVSETEQDFILLCIKTVFDNWHKLDNFTQSRTKLANIADDINNIITQLKRKQRGKVADQSQLERIARMG